jgi:nucleoside-diphosphate-sugar epimerase
LGTNAQTKTSISMLAQLIAHITGFKGQIAYDEEAPTGDWSRSTDSSKANALGWKHKVLMEEGVTETIKWWLAQQ